MKITKILNLLFKELPENFDNFDCKSLPLSSRRDACLSYKNSTVRALIHGIKRKKNRRAIACGGEILARYLLHDLTYPIIIPMPISRKRRSERGYNQCELLAREIKKHIDIEINSNILFRKERKNFWETPAKKQAFKKRHERIAEIHGVFSVNMTHLQKISHFDRRHFVVIDDVLTTGSTMNEAVSTLQKAGCTKVSGLALAH